MWIFAWQFWYLVRHLVVTVAVAVVTLEGLSEVAVGISIRGLGRGVTEVNVVERKMVQRGKSNGSTKIFPLKEYDRSIAATALYLIRGHSSWEKVTTLPAKTSGCCI
jgi:hypothetical protein